MIKTTQKVLPDRYIELEYIESTGTQSIDTGLPCNSKYRWEMTLQPTNASTGNSWLMGAIEQVGSSSTYKRFHPSNASATLAKWWAGSKDTTNAAIPANDKFDIIIGNRGATNVEVNINGDVQTIENPDITNLTFWLFQRNSNAASFQTFGNYRLYKFRVIDANDKVVMNLIPCIRKSDGTVCMYDKVSKSFFDNQGTGSFRPGTLTNLPDGYVLVDYLQSDGSQWVDTGVYGNENTYAEIDFQYYELSSTVGHGKLFGTRKASQDKAFVAGTGNGVITTSQQYFSQVDSGTIKDPSTKPYISLNRTNLCLSADGMYVDGVLGRQFDKVTPFTTDVTLWLFGYYNSGTDTPTGAVKGKYRCFGFLLKEGDVCNRFYFPMLDDDGTPCMYDVINGVPYYNEGAGDFTYGKVIKRVSSPTNVDKIITTRYKKVLPDGYTELEYIESTGAKQYIDTGIVPKTFDYTITYEGAIKTLSSGPNCAWGYMGGTSGLLPRWVCATFNSKYLLNANVTSEISNANTNNHTFVCKVYKKDGVEKWSSEIDGVVEQNDQTMESVSTWTSNTLSIYLFARHNTSGAGNYAPATMKRWICEKNGVEIRHLVPAKNAQGVVGMYDLVNGVFYTNAGTGTFVAGPTANKEVVSIHTRSKKNIFNDKNITDGETIDQSNGSIKSASNSSRTTVLIPVSPNTSYAWSTANATSPGNVRTHYYDINGNWVSSDVQSMNGGRFVTGSDIYYVRYSKASSKSTVASYGVQLERGTSATGYQPYMVKVYQKAGY